MRRWMGQSFVVLMGLLTAPALAQDQAPKKSPFDELPLGLGKLHWSMTMQDAKGIYPTLKTAASASALALDGYSYNGCGYAVGLTFAADKLVAVSLDALRGPGVGQCAVHIKEDFETRYAAAPNHLFYPIPARTEEFQESWDGPDATVEISTLPSSGPLSLRFKKG